MSSVVEDSVGVGIAGTVENFWSWNTVSQQPKAR